MTSSRRARAAIPVELTNRMARIVGVVVAMSLGLAGCGDEKKPSAAESAFCNGLVAFDKVSTPGGPDEEPVAADKKYAADVAGPLRTLMGNTPAKIRSDVARLDAAVKKV